MTIKEIQNHLQSLKNRGFIPTRRKGPTGMDTHWNKNSNLLKAILQFQI